MSRGYFSVGIYGAKNGVNVGTLWRTAGVFGAQYLFTVGQRYRAQASDTYKTTRHVPLFAYDAFEDMRAALPHDCLLVGVELTEGAEPIDTFKHPERACYMLGAEDHGLPDAVLERCHRVVKLPGKRSLNVATAGSIVLYDRWRAQQ